ncbi:radical SAM protein [Streptomyces sp. NPDC021622]|uniref:radical SAM protein n=1 Tax=Streptomyces sp. NPDC021622 TaxID=3155013 RepID=UPI003401E06D
MNTHTATRPPVPRTGQGRFRSALISTAGHCKIACGFCFRADRAHGYLPLPLYTRSLSRLKEAGAEEICLTGGEPAHHPKLRQLVRLAHQFGMPISVVTSARAPEDVERLEEVAHLLANVTVSADSAAAMNLGRTHRSAATGIATLDKLSATRGRILHVTYWQLTDAECRALHVLVAEAKTEVQFSPVMLDEADRTRAGWSLTDYLDQQSQDTTLLGTHFRLTSRFHRHVQDLQDLHREPPGRRRCQGPSLYVSAGGEIRRCPYGTASVSVTDPRAAIRDFLNAEPQERTTPSCAAICRAEPPPASSP